ncbi:hypothetical protein Acr_10g0007880 [Actinidia rufa]|uniref:Uncharacterized protein n=1 Tax=Actinidia rufa TaxID=165716 RepID=A0A7J0F9W7_9ERIC|nr:hypothetical protein Acr_10g0007880 [Actinidia rufa]
MMHPRTKHASNDMRGEDTNPELPMHFKPRIFKNMEIQKMWISKFKEMSIITGREFKRNFPLKYYRKMLAPMEALGWDSCSFCNFGRPKL